MIAANDDWLASLVKETHALLVSVDMNGRFTYANEATAKTLGYARSAELIGMSYLHFIHPDDRQRVLSTYSRQVEEQQASCLQEFRIINTAGEVNWFSFLSSLTIKDGEIIGQSGVAHDISARKRAEEGLHLLAQVTAASSDLIVVIGADYRYRFVNDIYLKARRLRPEDIIGHHMIDIVGQAKFEELGRPQADAGLRGESVESFEWTDFGRNDRHYLHVRVAPFRETDGEITGVVMIGSDITAVKRAEEELQHQTALFQNLFRSSPEAIAVLDHEDRVLETNRSFEMLFDYSQAEARGQAINDLLAPEPYRDDAENISQRVLGEGQVVEKEGIRCAKGGRPLEVSLIGYPLFLDQHKIGAYAIYRDITEQKRALKQLHRAHKTLLTILDGIDATVYVADMKSHEILFMNKCIIDAFGANSTGRLCYEVFRNLNQPCEHCTNENLLDFQGKPTGVCTWEGFNPITNRWYINYDRAIRWLDGRMVKLQIATDITERKLSEEEKKRLQMQLTQAQKMESVGRLAGGVAHDFNNMLGVILGHAELALMTIAPDAPLHDNLEEIKKAAQRSADLTTQLLAFARKQTVAPKVVDLNETVESALKMLRRLIGENIDLAWMPGRNLDPVFIDPSQVDQILTNLCVNARDAISGNGRVTIETDNVLLDQDYCNRRTGCIPGKYVLLAVGDDGCGIEAGLLSHIFEPFFSTKEMGKGTGLGLATVYGAVKQNKGFIKVISEPGHGTTFKIYLPRHSAKTVPLSEAGSAPAPLSGGETLLLVEDEPAILKMTLRLLEKMGYRVISAATPGEAVRLAREHQGHIDLLITDVVMPEMNGRDLASTILSIYPGIKRLFMSGYTAEIIAHHGVLEEGVHFIQKPFTMKDLRNKLSEALKDR